MFSISRQFRPIPRILGVKGRLSTALSSTPGEPVGSSTRVYFKPFRAEISASPGSSSTVTFSSPLEYSSDLQALVVYTHDTIGSDGKAAAISAGLTDLTNNYSVDVIEERNTDPKTVASMYNESLIHLQDASTSSTKAKGSYASHNASGFDIAWDTQPTGTGVVATIDGFAICGQGVGVDVVSHYHNGSTLNFSSTMDFPGVTSVDAAFIFSLGDASSTGHRVPMHGHFGTAVFAGSDSFSLLTKSDGTGSRVQSAEAHFDDDTIAGDTLSGSNRAINRIRGANTGTGITLTNREAMGTVQGFRFIGLALQTTAAMELQSRHFYETDTTVTPTSPMPDLNFVYAIGGFDGVTSITGYTNQRTQVTGQHHFIGGGVIGEGSFGYKQVQSSNQVTCTNTFHKVSDFNSSAVVVAASNTNAFSGTPDPDQEMKVTAVDPTTGEMTVFTSGSKSYYHKTGILLIEEVS